MKDKMIGRLRLCRRTSYIGLALVLLVYIALSYISANMDVVENLPAWTVSALQLLLGVGSALTVSGILLGIYYKGKTEGGPGRRK
ncbi:MAG: hypothetical protein ACOX81_02220 [Candidatus Heteroscillospira sp.]|jgi:hypothetical protein